LAIVFASLLCAWCGWVSGFRRFTTAATVTWVVSLAIVLAVDLLLSRGRRGEKPGLRLEPAGQPWPRPAANGRRQVLAGVSPWVGLSVVVLTWEILGIDTGTRHPHLTISALTAAFRPLAAAMLLLWMLVGMGYEVARVRAPEQSVSYVDDRGASGTPAHDCLTGPHVYVAVPALLLPASQPAGVAFWLCIVVAALAIDLISRRSGGRLASAEELVRFISSPMAANAFLIVAWTYAGYHLFAQ
jgi:hypothetical protein